MSASLQYSTHLKPRHLQHIFCQLFHLGPLKTPQHTTSSSIYGRSLTDGVALPATVRTALPSRRTTATSGGSSGGNKGTTGGSSNSAIGKGVDMATDKAGYGDKYDDKITKGVEVSSSLGLVPSTAVADGVGCTVSDEQGEVGSRRLKQFCKEWYSTTFA